MCSDILHVHECVNKNRRPFFPTHAGTEGDAWPRTILLLWERRSVKRVPMFKSASSSSIRSDALVTSATGGGQSIGQVIGRKPFGRSALPQGRRPRTGDRCGRHRPPDRRRCRLWMATIDNTRDIDIPPARGEWRA